jgi:CheY-like chemotaxis protein
MSSLTDKPSAKHKLLLLDDDQDTVELYREMFSQLPSKPEIHAVTTGARAMAMLETQPFTLLISDLKMPRMDGLQVLSIVRRKFPQLRTVVMTSIADEQFRARAYSMGVDLYLEKPASSKEIAFMLDCIESLLGQEEAGGFRGVQSKSLVDLIQLESLSQSSSVLRIMNGKTEGKIWIENGEIIDAGTGELSGEEAFRRILSWKTGSFEILPQDVTRPRRITASVQGLLLDSAQAMDEALAEKPEAAPPPAPGKKINHLSEIPGVEFALKLPSAAGGEIEQWGLDNPEAVAKWSVDLLKNFESLGDKFHFGTFDSFQAKGANQEFHLITAGPDHLALGLKRFLTKDQAQSIIKRVFDRWVS